MRNIETFPSKQMYPYLSLVERKVAEFYHNIDRRCWLVWSKWLIFITFLGQFMVSLAEQTGGEASEVGETFGKNLRTLSRRELVERSPCLSCSSRLSANPPLGLPPRSLQSIDTSPTLEFRMFCFNRPFCIKKKNSLNGHRPVFFLVLNMWAFKSTGCLKKGPNRILRAM